MLASRVEAGDLPPLAQRLPEKPYVVPHRWMTVGTYGGNLRLVAGSTEDSAIKEYSYGHSPLRWLNDGLDIGPGLVESWESNEDASVWTLHLRSGVKWSDGEPFTTADILFWWEDLVLDEEFAEGVPPDARSGTGTLAQFSAPDELTLVMTFDAPAPTVPEMIANWTNRGISASWVEPRHYLEQFHHKYNENVPNDWAIVLDQKRNPILNPESPVLTGWKLKTLREGRGTTWERNPYYWVVDSEGNQLPYIDTLSFQAVDNIEVRKLQIRGGEYDYVHGAFAGLTLADVSGLKRTQSRSGLQVIFWDSGSGTGSIFFFNQDYQDEGMRALIREPRFRQALSLAYDRTEVRKAVYFDTGELTTGGYGPKTREFHRGDGQQTYAAWRDSWVQYDPKRAEAMLDELDVVDHDGDGWRETPDRTGLVVYLDYPADLDPSGEHMKKNEQLKKNWEAVGIRTTLNPVPPTSFDDQWAQGKLMSNTAWEISSVTFGADMLWLMPMEPSRWASLQGQYYALRGTPEMDRQQDVDPYERTPPRMAAEPGGPVDRLWRISEQALVESDSMKRDRLIWDMVKIHIEEGPFVMGVVANYPQIELVKRELRNVPTGAQTALGGLVNDWHYPTPAVYDPEAWYWENPDAHT